MAAFIDHYLTLVNAKHNGDLLTAVNANPPLNRVSGPHGGLVVSVEPGKAPSTFLTLIKVKAGDNPPPGSPPYPRLRIEIHTDGRPTTADVEAFCETLAHPPPLPE